jgi:hypothetical protein
MDAGKVLAGLRKELDVLNMAIASLERLQHIPPGEGGRRRKPACPVADRYGVRAATVMRRVQ